MSDKPELSNLLDVTGLGSGTTWAASKKEWPAPAEKKVDRKAEIAAEMAKRPKLKNLLKVSAIGDGAKWYPAPKAVESANKVDGGAASSSSRPPQAPAMSHAHANRGLNPGAGSFVPGGAGYQTR